MCGITGVINYKSTSFSSIVEMTDAMSHRGPDGEGFLITNSSSFCQYLKAARNDAVVVDETHTTNVMFGHRRLAIVDLDSRAAQPMSDITGRYSIVFNGEIYNHMILRAELESLGYPFKTDHSDTEVILNAYAAWGEECLKRFNGMWSFCLWDKKENVFFLARDRAGKKPLFYASKNGVFYFASELKSLILHTDFSVELNRKSVYDYLTFMMVPAPRTLFKGVFKLSAGHQIKLLPGGEPIISRYWSPLTELPDYSLSEHQVIEGLRERLYEAAKIRMIADVEVGVLLSGGVDSSINLACLSKYATRKIRAFTVGFENQKGYQNEFNYARLVAQKFDAEYNELTLTEKEFIDFLPKMIYFQGEPVADTANIPLYYIAKKAREQGVKVLLGGEGSDELFVGYKLWKIARQFSRKLESRPSISNIVRRLHKISPFSGRRLFYYSWYDKIVKNQPVFWSGTELRSEAKKRSILSDSFQNELENYSSYDSIKDLHASYIAGGVEEHFRWMTAADLQNRLPDLLLARLDRMLMAASVEGRNPFLDVNVIEYAMRIPANLKTKGDEDKYILKRAFEGVLPNEILYRKKDSFTVPMDQILLTESFREKSIDSITRFNKSTGIFSQQFVEYLKKSTDSAELWNISNLSMWYDQYILK